MVGSLCRIERRNWFLGPLCIQTKLFPVERYWVITDWKSKRANPHSCLFFGLVVNISPSRYAQLIEQYNITSFNTTEYKGRFDITLVVPLRWVRLDQGNDQLQPIDMSICIGEAMERVVLIVLSYTDRALPLYLFRIRIGAFLRVS